MEIKDKIKNLRTKFNETQSQFGARFGISRNAVTMWEMGVRKPPKSKMELIDKLDNEYFVRANELKRYFIEETYRYILYDNEIAITQLDELIIKVLKNQNALIEDIWVSKELTETIETVVDFYPFECR